MSRKKRFEGYDFTELGKVWGLDLSTDGLDDLHDIDVIRKHIWNHFTYGAESPSGAIDPDVKKDMLGYLNALVKTGFSSYVPIYKAMKKLEDHEFVQVYISMLPHMWS